MHARVVIHVVHKIMPQNCAAISQFTSAQLQPEVTEDGMSKSTAAYLNQKITEDQNTRQQVDTVPFLRVNQTNATVSKHYLLPHPLPSPSACS